MPKIFAISAKKLQHCQYFHQLDPQSTKITIFGNCIGVVASYHKYLSTSCYNPGKILFSKLFLRT